MPTFHTGEVIGIIESRPGLQRVRLRFTPGGGPTSGDRGYVLTDLVGEVQIGDHVVCNTTAVELGLGTGGWHVVHWNLSTRTLEQPGPDHIMKLRYTSLQADVGTDELLYPVCDAPLGPIPVVACSLHSQMAVVAATICQLRPGLSVSYVMTDGACLPLVLSDLVVALVDRGVLSGTVSAGHAFGGDLEAVTVHSALGLARHVQGADVILVAMGPGVVGTGTALGTTAVEVAGVLDAARSGGAEPVLAVRASTGDQRRRQQGLSHHTSTAARLTSAEPWVAPIPPEAASLPGVRVRSDLDVLVPRVDPGSVLEGFGLRVTTMGRGPEADPLFFEAAAAAARLAVSLIV